MEDIRVSQVGKFTAKIVDRQISRHPSRSNVIIIYNDTNYDIYRDATSQEVARVNKLVIVEKDRDRFYVQEWADDEVTFLDEEDRSPWLTTFTITDLPRVPKQDDMLVIDGRKHTIAKVKPINAKIPNVITVLTYPERKDTLDPFKFVGINLYSNYLKVVEPKNHVGEQVVLEFLYGGNPSHYKIGTKWEPFHYKIKILLTERMTISLIENDNQAAPLTYEIDLL